MNFDVEIDKKDKKKAKIKTDKDDPEEIREILQVVSTEVPALVKNIFTSLYDPEIAENFGKGVGALYKQLKEQGLPEDMIKEIVMNFSESFNIIGKALDSDMIKQAVAKDRDD